MSSPAIEAVGLSKRFQLASERRTSLKERVVRGRAPAATTFWALKDATFTVPRGSSLGIIGHNGSGKSTVLKVLVGIYRPTAGTVRVNGSVSALLEIGAGFHPELTGRENIRLNATILGFTSREIDRLMGRIIEFADIGAHIDAPLKHYSSGMHVRLGFAVAVMVRPEILIVDEVIAVGDEEFQRKCYDYLHGLRRSGTSLIVVSHGLGQINDLCDEALWLDHGEPRMLGASRQVTRAYLDSVNASEIAKATSGGPGPGAVPATAARRGTGQVRVTQVELLGPAGTTAQVVSPGDPLQVRLGYQAAEEVRGVTFHVAIDTPQGLAVLDVGSDAAGPWRVGAGPGVVTFGMDSCLLAAGTYLVKPRVTAEGSLLDADDAGVLLTIRTGPDGSEGAAGLYHQPGSWALHAGSPTAHAPLR